MIPYRGVDRPERPQPHHSTFLSRAKQNDPQMSRNPQFPKRSKMRETRERLGWSQVELAEALGVDVGTVSRIERGDIPLRKLHILALEALEKRGEAYKCGT